MKMFLFFLVVGAAALAVSFGLRSVGVTFAGWHLLSGVTVGLVMAQILPNPLEEV